MSLIYRKKKVNIEYFLILCIAFTGPMTFFTLRPIVNVFLVDLFIFIYFVYFIFNAKDRKVNKYLLLSIFFIVLGYTLSALFSDYIVETFVPFIQYFMVFFIIIAFSTNAVTLEMMDRVMSIYIYGVIVSILISLCVYFGYFSIPNQNYYVAGRFNGVWGNPNALAKEMTMFIMLLFSLIFFCERHDDKKYLYLFLIIAAIYLLLTSASFGGVVFLFLSFLLLMFILLRTITVKRFLNFSIYSIVFCLAILFVLYSIIIFYEVDLIYFVPERFISRILSVDDFDDAGSGKEKIGHIILGLEMFLSNPLLGTGLGAGRYYNTASSLFADQSVSFHSFYITIMVEGGIFVLLGFIGLFAFFMHKSINTNGAYKFVFIVIVLTFLINLIINNNIFNRYLWFPVVFSVFTILDNQKNKVSKKDVV